MTTTATTDDLASCWRCGGPCLTYKGSVHGWTCQGCLAQYLEQSAAKADERDRRERQKNARSCCNATKQSHRSWRTVGVGRWWAGCVPHPRPGVGPSVTTPPTHPERTPP